MVERGVIDTGLLCHTRDVTQDKERSTWQTNINRDMKMHMILIWIITTIYTYVHIHTYEGSIPTLTSFLSYISQYQELPTPLLWIFSKMIHKDGMTS